MTESHNDLQKRAEEAEGSPSELIKVALDVARSAGDKEWAAKLVEQSLDVTSSAPRLCNNYVRVVKAADLLCQRADLVGRALDSFMSRFPDRPSEFIYEACGLAYDLYEWPDFSRYSDEESKFLREKARNLLMFSVQGICEAGFPESTDTDWVVYDALDAFLKVAEYDNSAAITDAFLNDVHECVRRSDGVLGWAFLAEAHQLCGDSVKADVCLERLENALGEGRLSKSKLDNFKDEVMSERDFPEQSVPERSLEDHDRWMKDSQRWPEERYKLDPPEQERHLYDPEVYLRLKPAPNLI